MAKVKIQGNASGTGILTVTAPNTSTDRTITLPDADVTLGAATPSIDDNGNATAITIDSNENVGIGHPLNTHTQKLVIKKNATVDNLAGGALINLVNEQGAGNTAALRFTGVNQNAYLGYFDGTTSTARRLSIGVGANAEQFSFTSNGLTFNGDTAAANALDDYEEGTWTPAFTFDSGTFSGSYAINAGIYTKVGRIVHASFTFNTSSVNLSGIDSGTAVRVGGLPFTSDSTTGNASSTSTLRTQNWNSNANSPVIGYMDGNTNFIRLMRYNGSTGYNTDYKCVSADLRTSGDSNQLLGTITYQAS